MEHRSTRYLLALALSAGGLAGAERPGKILAAYFEGWGVYPDRANYHLADAEANGAAAKLTHLFYAFANVSPSGQCQIRDPKADLEATFLRPVNGLPSVSPLFGNFAELVKLKRLHPNLKILISIGGASETNTAAFATAAATPELRSRLAASCIDMFIKGNTGAMTVPDLFDGVDIDWEFPAAGQKQHFTALIEEFRAQLDALGKQTKRRYLLTIAAPAGAQNYSNIELAKVSRLLDFINLMTYDYHGTWDSVTNHAAPLFGSGHDPAQAQRFWIAATVDAYLEAGVAGKKLVLGVPFYGRGWTGVPNLNHGLFQNAAGPAPPPSGDTLAEPGVATYATLARLAASPAAGFTRYREPGTVWIYNAATGTFWSYDDPASIAAKMRYIRTRVRGGLGGGMFWALKDDDAGATLLRAMAKGLGIR